MYNEFLPTVITYSICTAGVQNCTMNVHLVSHLTHYVKLYGPLWTHSCFAFESLNGYLMQLKHGTQHVVTQVQENTS